MSVMHAIEISKHVDHHCFNVANLWYLYLTIYCVDSLRNIEIAMGNNDWITQYDSK
jgi:hypothetical protein